MSVGYGLNVAVLVFGPGFRFGYGLNVAVLVFRLNIVHISGLSNRSVV